MGHEVTVFTSDILSSRGEERSNLRLVRLNSKRIGTDILPFGLRRAIKESDVDIVHIHSPLSLITTQASILARDTPLVATYHGDYYKASLLGNALKCLRNRLQLPYVLRNARAVIALSENDRGLLINYGIDMERIVTVPPGLDLAQFAVDPAVEDNGDKNILYVGRVVYEKGIEELIIAFDALCDLGVEANLVVAGDGNALDDMKALTKRLGLETKVRFTGWVMFDDLIELYRRATAVVLPSFSEGMPYAMLEAMAAGKPVISSNVSGMSELVIHGVNGLLYDINDRDQLKESMLRLVSDPLECRRMGQRAREHCSSRFSRQRWLEDTVEVYERAL